MSCYLIACGGTGGHLAPGIALAQELTARGHAAVLLISQKQVDRQLAAKYPELTFRSIPAAPLGWRPAALGRFGLQQTRGLLAAWRQIRTVRPAAIVGFGGFTTTAIILIGRLCGVPVALHESNRVPGRAVRLMAPLARRVYLPAGVTLPQAAATTIRHAGLPVRAEIRPESREQACAALGLEATRPVVAVLGGSQGASALNDWARQAAPELAAAGIQLCTITGTGKGGPETRRHPGPAGAAVSAVFLPFCDRMATLLSAADLVVSRAGAGTLAELVRCHTPAILVPYPHAADNHQAANAENFAREGAGEVLEQSRLAELTERVLALVQAPEQLEAFRVHLRRLDGVDALRFIADDLEELPRHGPRSGTVNGSPAPA